jgi:MoxR-like ATPase
MAERQATVDGQSRPLPDPFLILATQNPLDHEGTFPLPEAQLDRFFLKTTLGYPSLEDELRVVQVQRHAHPLVGLRPVIDVDALRAIQAAVEDVYIDPIIQQWLIELVRATRNLEVVSVGASVRGSLALEQATRARALLEGRPFVEPDDVEALFEPIVLHRVLTDPYRLEMAGTDDHPGGVDLLRSCLEQAPRPGLELSGREL